MASIAECTMVVDVAAVTKVGAVEITQQADDGVEPVDDGTVGVDAKTAEQAPVMEEKVVGATAGGGAQASPLGKTLALAATLMLDLQPTEPMVVLAGMEKAFEVRSAGVRLLRESVEVRAE